MVFVLLISFFFLDIVHITKGDRTSTTCYLGDVGVGALAGVLAIVISVTMVAVQFSSQYSTRVVHLYIKSFAFWLLIGVYIPTIVFNVLLLNQIEAAAAINIKVIDLSIVLTILCFILIVPYSIFVLSDLRPLQIIEKMLRKIDQKFVKTNEGQEMPLPISIDYLLPVAEIIEKAVRSYDRSTIMNGLENMYKDYDHLITKETFMTHREIHEHENNKVASGSIHTLPIQTFSTFAAILFCFARLTSYQNNFLSKYFLYYFSNIANTAILNSDNNTLKKIADIFVKMAEPHNSKEMTDATDNAIDALRQIAESAANQKLTDVTIYTLKKILEVVNSGKSDKNGLRLFELGQKFSEQKELETATQDILRKLSEFEYFEEIGIIGIKVAQNNQKDATIEAVATLVDLADLAERSDSEKKAEDIMDVAIGIIVEATNHELEVQFASEKIGRYMCKKISKAQNNEEKIYNINQEEEKLNIYGNEACKFNILECKPNEIILEVKNCCIKTIEKLDDKEIKSYCDKTKKCRTELPVCTITYSYLACAIKRVKQCKNVKLKKPLEWNENGLCKLTFVLE